MSRKKDTVKGGATLSRIRENSRLMRAHESMVDFISGRRSEGSILEVFASRLLGLHFLRTFDCELDNDIIYSDDDYNDDDDDDEDDNHFYTQNASYRPLEPHPRIKQLTEEEADKHARELMGEEERRKDKTQRNKRKKLRKKEKKRLQKENAVKDILPDEENGKSESGSSEIQQETPVIESIAEANDSPESGKTQSGTEAAGCDENSTNNKEETRVIESIAEVHDSPESGKTQSGTEAAGCDENSTNNKETPGDINTTDNGEQKDLDLNNSYASKTKLVARGVCNERPARERKKKKTKLLEVLQSKEEKPKVVEEPKVQKQEEEKHEPNKEKITDPASEVLAKRSREFAGIGNQFAASGQYEMAVKCFTDAIKCNPTEFKLFGNRSLCYERIQQYENALGDADLALCLEPNWIKGLFRKGKALCGLKRYYEASLIYEEVLKLEGSSAEAMRELKRAQTLHLMEMGFTWAQSSEALKTHATLEQAVEALFDDDRNPGPGDAGASCDNTDQPVVQEENYDAGEWTVLQTSRPRMQQVKEFGAFVQSRSNSQSPTPRPKNSGKLDLLSVWVGSLAPAVTYSTLHELFSRAGTVHSIKMLLEQQCAFVNYTRKEDCDRAVQCINGMVVEGAPLLVRHPCKFHAGLGVSSLYKKECFFWRTTGCTRQDCTFRHVPEHKNLDKDKFTGRLGGINL